MRGRRRGEPRGRTRLRCAGDHPVRAMRRRSRPAYVPGMRTAHSTIAVVTVTLVLGACGQSAEEKAQTKVCDARDDIGKQVNELKSMTPATVTTDAVKQNLD